MGVTVKPRTVRSRTVDNDDSEVASKFGRGSLDPGTITFSNLGTGPSVVQAGNRFTVTSGSGVPTIGATITIPHRLGVAPSKAWLRAYGNSLGIVLGITTIDATNIVLGVGVAPAASTAYPFELIVE